MCLPIAEFAIIQGILRDTIRDRIDKARELGDNLSAKELAKDYQFDKVLPNGEAPSVEVKLLHMLSVTQMVQDMNELSGEISPPTSEETREYIQELRQRSKDLVAQKEKEGAEYVKDGKVIANPFLFGDKKAATPKNVERSEDPRTQKSFDLAFTAKIKYEISTGVEVREKYANCDEYTKTLLNKILEEAG